MRHLLVNGVKRQVPPYPHHKNYVYRVNRFFNVKSLLDYIMLDGLALNLKKHFNNIRYKCKIPLNLLIDPTSACNLQCKGCWAADYEKTQQLSYDTLDRICGEAVKLGIRDILMTGGEPLIRKKDLLKLCDAHRNISFGVFTNGTLIDEAFADEMQRLENINVFISIEGFREQTDFRRGEGTFDKVIRAMDLLRERDIGFGFSACYHAKNYKEVSSDEFLKFMQEKGAWLGWMFNYMPLGSDADVSLCCSPAQRAEVMERISHFYKKHHLVLIDMMNSGHKAYGCVAAGNGFAHINANGDLEPCAFCHYADTNIHNISLAEALRSPFFKQFRAAKPFSYNLLRPCPVMDHPDVLAEITSKSKAGSTHLHHGESAADLAKKTRPVASGWKPVADSLAERLPESDRKRHKALTRLMRQFGYFR